VSPIKSANILLGSSRQNAMNVESG